jgi:hypothetical protein
MKKNAYLFILTALIVFTSLSSCKKECSGENPRARIVNGGTAKADVQVKTTGGNTVNINNVLVGTSSEYSSFASGVTTYTINVGVVSKVTTVTMETCYDYDISIDGSNNITTTPVKR